MKERESFVRFERASFLNKLPEAYLLMDLHTHTVYSDGKNNPRQMIEAAIEKGLKIYGISDHSYTWFDLSCCMEKDAWPEYQRELSKLKEEYADRIDLYIGIEQDYFSGKAPAGADYVIGSVHCIREGDDHFAVDDTPELLTDKVNEYYWGDFYRACEAYYELVSEIVPVTGADIIGHFDLITKFNRGGRLFDESDERYKRAALKAADKLISYNIPFEINTGAMSRGYTDAPYPAPFIREYIKERGGRFILSSDAHSMEAIAFEFGRLAPGI